MVQQASPTDTYTEPDITAYPEPDISNLVTEDDTPVDNWASEKHQRFLVSCLYSSRQSRNFLAAANVGIFHTTKQPPIVPDVFLSIDVTVPDNWWEKKNRCYLVWEFGKPPEVAIEIVSNKQGEELGNKLKIYSRMRVLYYVVFDPSLQLGDQVLRVYELRGMRYVEKTDNWLEEVELGLTLWEGEFEGRQNMWLRWCDAEAAARLRDGNILLTGDERATLAELRAQLLAEQLRNLGVEPDTLS